MPPPRLKILCLHGFTSNGAVHAHQLRRITKLLPEYDFIFPDGPHKVDIASAMDMTNPDNMAWYETVNAVSSSGHRAWWFAQEGKNGRPGEFLGLETSLDFIGDLMQKKGPFHAICGFSQGGCFAGILCAMLQENSASHVLRKHLPTDALAPVTGVIFSGFRARFPQYDEIYEAGIDLPLLHVMGANDSAVTAARSEKLLEICHNSEILHHEGGHNIPKSVEHQAQVADFLRKYLPIDGGYKMQSQM